jgi:hypothetical protein
MQGLVEDAIAKALTVLIPSMMQWLSDWINGGRVGPCPVPSMGSSNSANMASEPIVNTLVSELNVPITKSKVPRVYDDWDDCVAQVNEFPGNSYKGYKTKEEAEAR